MTRATGFLFGFVLMACIAPTPAQQPPATGGEKPTDVIVVFGDSITAAKQQPVEKQWPTLLEKRLREAAPQRRVQVVNAGVGGNTSREGLARLQRDVLKRRPDLVTIEFGGNDATDDPARHVELKEFEQNLQTMIENIREVNPRAVVVLTTFPVVVDQHHAHGTRHGGLDKYIEPYRESVRRMAKAQKLPLWDMDAVVRQAPDRFVLPDGVHLTADGNEAVAQAADALIRDIWKTK